MRECQVTIKATIMEEATETEMEMEMETEATKTEITLISRIIPTGIRKSIHKTDTNPPCGISSSNSKAISMEEIITTSNIKTIPTTQTPPKATTPTNSIQTNGKQMKAVIMPQATLEPDRSEAEGALLEALPKKPPSNIRTTTDTVSVNTISTLPWSSIHPKPQKDVNSQTKEPWIFTRINLEGIASLMEIANDF